MMLCDWQVAELARHSGMIEPFNSKLTTDRCLSHGLSSAGYDAMLGTEFAAPRGSAVLDPKADPDEQWHRFTRDRIVIEPGEFVLGHTVETFKLPRDVVADCVGKSTYARCGLSVLVTPIEPEWAGQVTLELANVGHRPIVVHANEGICQFRFWRIQQPEVTYASRDGKYMDQRGVVLPRVRR